MSELPDAPRPRRGSPLSIFLNPYLQILLGALLAAAGEILLKKGATSVPRSHGAAALLGFTPLMSGWTWLGILSYILSLISWLHVLRTVPLSVAFPLITVVQIFVPIGAAFFLHESVKPKRWLGIALIICGVLAIVRPLVKAEEKL